MSAWLDRVLGRVTMYGLVIIVLSVIGAASLVLTFVGALAFGPLALLLHAVALLLASYLANGVFGILFRTRPQLSSTAITALLLVFILQPSLDPLAIIWNAAAAIIAVASKYLIAWRGRHILNPAAAGAFVVGLFGTAFASWWVGTGPLLPFVVIGAAAVLFRTRHFPLAGVYLGLAVLLSVGVGLVNGFDAAATLQTAVLSSPVVFFAGYMLSEPLTLPPRRRQQLALAALVAVLTVVPFFLAPGLYNSPQLALLIGNIGAFLLGQRRGIRLDFVGRRQLSPTSWEYEFIPTVPVRFLPGQFMELTLPHSATDARGWRRYFSIASAPTDATIKFGIRLPPDASAFKRALGALETGTRISATSVQGDFVLPRDTAKKLLLVAGGIGMTPYLGQLGQNVDEKQGRDIVVVYAVSSNDDLAYWGELESSGVPVALVSPSSPDNLPGHWTWIGAGPLSGDMLDRAVPDVRDRHAYLSGPPAMVSSLKTALRAGGVKRVHTDVFLGY